jgi:hypothetical protein
LAGYANRLISIKFLELSTDPENDPLWVAIRNPRLLAPGETRLRAVPLDPETNQPLSQDDAEQAMYEQMAKLIASWRMYDSTSAGIDDQGNEIDQPLLSLPATPESVAKLPIVAITAIANEIKAAQNPT